MEIRRRTDEQTSPLFDVRPIENLLRNEFRRVYIIFSTLENDATEAWEQGENSFLLIHIPKEKIISRELDYKAEIIKHLPLIDWMDAEELIRYVEEHMSPDEVLD